MSRLPSKDAITAHSRKFYDGTYTWDTSGFTDESGEYRVFDCMDPEARAPTPLPPAFDDDESRGEAGGKEEEERREEEGRELSYQLERELFGTPIREGNTRRSSEFSEGEGQAVDSGTPKVSDGPDCFQFASQDGRLVLVRKDELFIGHKNKDGLISKLEGIVLAYQHLDKELSLEKCHELCGTELSAKSHKGEEVSNSTKQEKKEDGNRAEQIMVDVLEKPGIVVRTQTPRKEERSSSTEITMKDDRRISSGSSGLSDVPSDLSAQSPSNKNAPTPPSRSLTHQKQEKTEEDDASKADYKPPRKTATRGIAQKVRKSTRKTTTTKSKSVKKPGSSTSLAELHSGTYRRSARQEAKLGTGK